MKEKILSIISTIMEVNINDLNENSSNKNVENWDSLRHMNLIVSLEEEFDVEFTDDQIVTISNYNDIVAAIESQK